MNQLQKCAGKVKQIQHHCSSLKFAVYTWGLFEIWHTHNYEWDGNVCVCVNKWEREWKGSAVETWKYAVNDLKIGNDFPCVHLGVSPIGVQQLKLSERWEFKLA